MHTHLKLFAFLHWGFLDISSSFLFLPSLCSRDEGDKRVIKRRKKRHSLMEPRADAPWEWQPLPKIRRETKTRIQAKIKQKGDSERREPIFGSFSLQVTLAACLIMLKKGGYIKFILISCFCYYSFCKMFPCFCLGPPFFFFSQPGEKRLYQLPSDPRELT